MKAFLTLLILTSCSVFELNPKHPLPNFQLTNPDQNLWKKNASEILEHNYYHQKLKATFYAYGSCDPNFNQNLNQMQRTTLRGFQAHPNQTRSISLVDREALSSHFEEILDGVQIKGIITSLNKNNCQFEFILIQSQTNNLEPEVVADYEKWLQGFKF